MPMAQHKLRGVSLPPPLLAGSMVKDDHKRSVGYCFPPSFCQKINIEGRDTLYLEN